MLYQVCKRFIAAGVPVVPGDIVDPSGWRNLHNLVEQRRLMPAPEKTEVQIKSLEGSIPNPQKSKNQPTTKKKASTSKKKPYKKKASKKKSVLASRPRRTVRKAI